MPRAHVVPDGAKIAALRGEADLTQWELAQQAGYGLRTIGKIEGGRPTGAKTLSAAATVLSRRLNRPIALADLMVPGNGHANGHCHAVNGAGLVMEAVKFLDLSDRRRLSLTDHYHFQHWPAAVPLIFRYDGIGRRASGSCLTHPGSSQWLESGAGVAEMHVDVKDRGAGQGGIIQNRIVLADGLEQRLPAAIALPTECLTFLVLFPEGRRCQAVSGTWRLHDSEEFLPAEPGPTCFADGKLAYWRIAAPPVGATYQIRWEW